MAKHKKGRRVILIADTKSIDADSIRDACENMTELQGMVVFDKYFDAIKEKVDLINSMGHQKYTSSQDWLAKCKSLELTEKIALAAERFSLVFAVCNEKDIDLLYQDVVHITTDVVTLH